MIGCMLTWTTYGSWLQGDRRGYVKDGEILGGNEGLQRANQRQMKAQGVTLDMEQRLMVRDAVLQSAKKAGHEVLGLAVGTTHVHLLIGVGGEPWGRVVSRCKNAARKAIEADGFDGKLWTKGFDKRYCNSREELVSRARYIGRHKDGVVFLE